MIRYLSGEVEASCVQNVGRPYPPNLNTKVINKSLNRTRIAAHVLQYSLQFNCVCSPMIKKKLICMHANWHAKAACLCMPYSKFLFDFFLSQRKCMTHDQVTQCCPSVGLAP